MSWELEAVKWDAQYESGRYQNESPVAFVQDILAELGEEGKKKFGLYVGCGNGRNFIPLLESGLDLRGIDISPVGIGQLIARRPEAEKRVWVSSFGSLTSARVFDYVVAIQVFQHGNQDQAYKNFELAHDVLKPGGKLFLRVNSVSTQIQHNHEVIDRSSRGGFSVTYREGPKTGTNIHFFSEQELTDLALYNRFEIIKPFFERVEPRHEQADGVWAQWETIWQKR